MALTFQKAGREAAIKEINSLVLLKDSKAWSREAKALEHIGRRNLFNVVQVKAMLMQASKCYFIFPWANGGNLMDFWERNNDEKTRLNIARRLPNIVKQLMGISYALRELHNFSPHGKLSYRHGDLKPENILLFFSNNSRESRESPDIIGTWKMSDLGLARLHYEATGARYGMAATSTRAWGSTSYKPPEASGNPNSPTSRLFDMWSIGCLILQLITWLIYGMDRVVELAKRTVGMDRPSCFWTGRWTSYRGWQDLTVHLEVRNLIDELKQHLRGSGALLALLELVERDLLVTRLPRHRTNERQQCRTDARGLHSSLQIIHDRCKKDIRYSSSTGQLIRTWRPSNSREVRGGGKVQQSRNVSLCLWHIIV